MDRDAIITIITNHAPYKRYCNKLCNGKDIYMDVFQEFNLHMLEMDEDELIDIYSKGYLENYCLKILFRLNYHRTKPAVNNPCSNPLYQISTYSSELTDKLKYSEYDNKIDLDFNSVMDYVQNDKSIKQEDLLLLEASLDNKLIDISRSSGIPYISLKMKQKRLKDKIKKNVNI